ncbi:ABC transporter permease [Arthrobacter globiformis]|uniref:ABC transporter permease n=1 Tax=Arthrobacter globiformis TaxID=1665 RepID=UPI0027811D44|nr:ABC transporter permease [Arthrobacter globiformis]MDQ0864614.1 ribose transport system permease protein [Arthrobacter globiformis]
MTILESVAVSPSNGSPTAKRASRTAKRFVLHGINWFMPVATMGLMLYFTVATKSFLTPGNLLAVLTQNGPTFIVAVVAAVLLMAGFVDLSVGSTLALAGVCSGLTFLSAGLAPGLMAGLAVGTAIGVINGILIGWLNLSPLVVTLGMLAATRGIAQYLAPDSLYGFPEDVNVLGNGALFGVSYLGVAALLVIGIALLTMNRLPIGRKIVAIGVNSRASYLVGIPVKRITVLLYIVLGLAAGLAGVLQVARLDSAPSGTLGVGFEVTVLTAVLLGGIPFNGGRGSILRVVLGVWLIAVLKNGLTLLNLGPEIAGIVTGSVLVLAAGLEAVRYWVHRTK